MVLPFYCSYERFSPEERSVALPYELALMRLSVCVFGCYWGTSVLPVGWTELLPASINCYLIVDCCGYTPLVEGVTAINLPDASYSMNFDWAVAEPIGPVDLPCWLRVGIALPLLAID
jgi:hypothetical protein